MNHTTRPHIAYCLTQGAMRTTDVERLLGKLRQSPRVQGIAQEFGTSADDMAPAALDGGIVFVRSWILGVKHGIITSDTGMLFSPAPLPDAGWDVMSDSPDEREFYIGFCERLCRLEGIPPMVLEHHRFSAGERILAQDLGAVANVIAVMDRLELAYVPEHWPVGGAECTITGVPRCEVHARPLVSAAS